MSSDDCNDHPMDQGASGTKSDHAAGEVNGVAASMNERERTSNKKTKPSLPFVYPRQDSVDADDSSANYDAEADEATIPVVDAAFAPPGDNNDPRAERLRAAEKRAADAEAGRLAAERQLADEKKSLWERLANLSKRQWLGIGLATFGLLVFTASVTVAVCGSDMCKKRKTTTTPPPTMLSARAQFIVDYINNITLTGRTFPYPDDTTPEGRALAWLVEDNDVARKNEEENDIGQSNGTSTMTTARNTDNDKVSLRQRYALATLWFQTPDNFDDTVYSPSSTWGNSSVHECDWYGVTCNNTVGLVDGLQLQDIVRGNISTDLALLTDLTYFELLFSDQLVGTLPSSLGQYLTALTGLFLGYNALTGTIPSTFGRLTDLLFFGVIGQSLDRDHPVTIGRSDGPGVIYCSHYFAVGDHSVTVGRSDGPCFVGVVHRSPDGVHPVTIWRFDGPTEFGGIQCFAFGVHSVTAGRSDGPGVIEIIRQHLDGENPVGFRRSDGLDGFVAI
jgi:hypothetical protein